LTFRAPSPRDLHCVGHVARWGATEAQNRDDDVVREGRHRNHDSGHLVVLFRPAPAHFQSPSDNHRGANTSQRRPRRNARSVSVSSQPRCTLGFTSGPTLRRPRGAPASYRSSEPSRRRCMRAAVTGTTTVAAWLSSSDLHRLTFSRRRMTTEAATSQRRRRRNPRSVSVSSQPRCTLGSSPGTAPRRTPSGWRGGSNATGPESKTEVGSPR
jgi:hypothetical protein